MQSTERMPKRRCTSGMQRSSWSQSSIATGRRSVAAMRTKGASAVLTFSPITPGNSGDPYSATQSSPCRIATMTLSAPAAARARSTTRSMTSWALSVVWMSSLISLRPVLNRSRAATSSKRAAFWMATAAWAATAPRSSTSRSSKGTRSPGVSTPMWPMSSSPANSGTKSTRRDR